MFKVSADDKECPAIRAEVAAHAFVCSVVVLMARTCAVLASWCRMAEFDTVCGRQIFELFEHHPLLKSAVE